MEGYWGNFKLCWSIFCEWGGIRFPYFAVVFFSRALSHGQCQTHDWNKFHKNWHKVQAGAVCSDFHKIETLPLVYSVADNFTDNFAPTSSPTSTSPSGNPTDTTEPTDPPTLHPLQIVLLIRQPQVQSDCIAYRFSHIYSSPTNSPSELFVFKNNHHHINFMSTELI